MKIIIWKCKWHIRASVKKNFLFRDIRKNRSLNSMCCRETKAQDDEVIECTTTIEQPSTFNPNSAQKKACHLDTAYPSKAKS